MEAEKLLRESLRIRVLINCNYVGNTVGLLASFLRVQGKLGSEMKELFEQSVANNIQNYGPDGMNTAVTQINFGLFYRELCGTITDKMLIGVSYTALIWRVTTPAGFACKATR
jgi:hypothetical protein